MTRRAHFLHPSDHKARTPQHGAGPAKFLPNVCLLLARRLRWTPMGHVCPGRTAPQLDGTLQQDKTSRAKPSSWAKSSSWANPAGRTLPAGQTPNQAIPTRRKSFRAENRRIELLMTPLFGEFLPENAIACGRMDVREGARVALLLRRRPRCHSSSVAATKPLPRHSPPLFETSKCRWRRRFPSRNPQREAQGHRCGTSDATVGS